MDFLIGGVPRSGTTIGGITFNGHPEGFCYAAETHWIPFLSGVAGNAPVPRAGLPNLRKVFAVQNRRVLVEKVRRSVERGGSRRMLVFDAGEIDALTDQAMALLEAGMFGAELCGNAMRILREYVHKKVGRPIIGEKSPANVFAFRDYGALGAGAAFMFMREPFAVIRSMQNRGREEDARSAEPFRRNLMELIGMYVMHMEAVSAARAQPRTSVIAYEDMLSNPREVVGRMFGAAGLPVNDRALEKAARRVRVITPGIAWEHFPPGERALILGLTETSRRNSPYDQSFFEGMGLDATQLGELPDSGNAVMPMFGVNAPSPWGGERWLMRDSCLAVVHNRNARQVELSLRADFPESVLARGETATLTVRDYAGKRTIARLEVIGGVSIRSTLRLELGDVTPICTGRFGSIGMLELNSSHAFRPSIDPLTRFRIPIPVRTGDHRLLSFMFTGSSFS